MIQYIVRMKPSKKNRKIEVVTLPVGQLQTNCYLVTDRKTRQTLIIDPGDDADYIERILKDTLCIPVGVVATHGHFDHILAVTELKLAYNIPFQISKDDEFLVKYMQSSAMYFLRIAVDPPPIIDNTILNKGKIKIGDSALEIIATPGHTPGSICLYSKQDKILFTGDLLFADGGVGRTDFSYSSTLDLTKSLHKIFTLPHDIVIYPGHGNFSTLKGEIKNHANFSK